MRKGEHDMDWIALITTLITTILPLIINKGPAVSKVALQRRAVKYAKLADETDEVYSAFALGELAFLCECLAVCETQAEQQQLLAAANGSMSKFGSTLKELEA